MCGLAWGERWARGRLAAAWRGRSRAVVLAAVAALAAAGAAVAWWVVSRERPTAAMRGERLANRLGCFACHGAGGLRGAPNPGSKEGPVPSWEPVEFVKHVESEAEIREWVLYGAPRREWVDGKKPADRPRAADAGLLAMPPLRGACRRSRAHPRAVRANERSAAGSKRRPMAQDSPGAALPNLAPSGPID